MSQQHPMALRFRGFLPVVVDVETAGFDQKKDALLEVAAQVIDLDEWGTFSPGETISEHILPFKNANLDPKSLAFNKIDPYHPFRFAVEESESLKNIFQFVKSHVKRYGCQRAVLVGHNAWFDLGFLKAASERTKLTLPFHQFTSLDTASLSALVYGQTVLSKALEAANIPYDNNEAHSALYDTECTAKLFCAIVNKWEKRG